jgi:nitrate/nitrite transport system ATP-binding protein
MSFFDLNDVGKTFVNGVTRTEVLTGVNLHIKEGEFVAIVGFSGSGKSTLISLMAGLTKPNCGSITLRGKPVTGPGPDRGVVFQNYSLLPWLTVFGNIALGVDQVFSDWSSDKRKEHVEKYIKMVNLFEASHKRPHELSGGMRQRVSVARALAMNPEILLLDEPLSALDALTRSNLQNQIAQIWEQDKKTVLMITNDVDEGILLADRIIPLQPGPNATLGPAFEVSLPRPRDRKALNHDPEFQRIRNEVTKYLVDASTRQRSITKRELKLPQLQPKDWTRVGA